MPVVSLLPIYLHMHLYYMLIDHIPRSLCNFINFFGSFYSQDRARSDRVKSLVFEAIQSVDTVKSLHIAKVLYPLQ